MKGDFPNASKSFQALNPHLFPMGAVEAHRSELAAARALDDGSQEHQSSKASLGVRVSLVSYRRRLLDSHDNLPYSVKPLVDAIAATLGLDDSKIQWEYGQVQTRGEQGVMVRVEII